MISGSVLIARQGRVLFCRGYGPANREYDIPNGPETKFRLGSMSKQFTAAAVLLLQERGLLDVQDPLSKFYPDYPRGEEITLHHLLTHTSGIINPSRRPDYGEKLLQPLSIDQVIEWFRDDSLTAEPGQAFSYSNAGYILLAGVIERISGLSYADFLRKNIFEPLGMRNTGQDEYTAVLKNRASGYVRFGPEVRQAPYRDMPFLSGAGSLYSTVMDLYLWDRALSGGLILSEESRRMMFTPHLSNYGYGWFIEDRDGHRAVSHRGEISGFIGSIDRYPEDSLLVVALFNFESTFARPAIRGLWEIAFGRQPKPLLARDPAIVANELLRSYAGLYRFPGEDTLRVGVEGDRLYVLGLEAREKSFAEAQKPDLFFVRGLNALIRFESRNGEPAEGLTLYNSVHALPARRI